MEGCMQAAPAFAYPLGPVKPGSATRNCRKRGRESWQRPLLVQSHHATTHTHRCCCAAPPTHSGRTVYVAKRGQGRQPASTLSLFITLLLLSETQCTEESPDTFLAALHPDSFLAAFPQRCTRSSKMGALLDKSMDVLDTRLPIPSDECTHRWGRLDQAWESCEQISSCTGVVRLRSVVCNGERAPFLLRMGELVPYPKIRAWFCAERITAVANPAKSEPDRTVSR
mmetsp:Transcript_14937/g.32420  ORF Transcript_14937/g.32420 Transcript_14937/m.32420 type:complete len:226 (-) Transcript_14937:198-875(-)